MTKPKQKSAVSSSPALTVKSNCSSPIVRPLAEELLQLDDDFTEFSEIGAFLCHAFAAALIDHESINKDVISGARRCSNWLQFRSMEIRDDIRQVHARYTAEHKKAGTPS